MYKGLAFSSLSQDEQASLGYIDLELCIFMEKELPLFQRAQAFSSL